MCVFGKRFRLRLSLAEFFSFLFCFSFFLKHNRSTNFKPSVPRGVLCYFSLNIATYKERKKDTTQNYTKNLRVLKCITALAFPELYTQKERELRFLVFLKYACLFRVCEFGV